MPHFKELVRKLLHIEDTSERTALAYAAGIFLGFSPFLGFHTLMGVAVAFLFRLNRVAVLLGVWSNTPWWIVPYYSISTWVGMWVVGIRVDQGGMMEMFRLGMEKGFLGTNFWTSLVSQSGLLLSFTVGSLILAALLSLAAYPLSLRWIKFYRSKREKEG